MSCQRQHWPTHKPDCRHFIRSPDWQPVYIREKRQPRFFSVGAGNAITEDIQRKSEDRYSQGMPLWGNMPALDILNVSRNEKDVARDYNIAFVASGDIRDVVHTICALPNEFSRKLTILINDISTLTTCRNMMILLILGVISNDDTVLAVDVALHFWYSITYPIEYQARLEGVMATLVHHLTNNLNPDQFIDFPLGSQAKLKFFMTPLVTQFLDHFTHSRTSTRSILSEYSSVRTAPSREDFRGRMYAGMRPSHHLAFHRYQENGLLLPFGAPYRHFTAVNTSLFSPTGEWLQTDYADPLEGYSPEEVIKAGKSHDASTNNIYGCLYFHLTDQLRNVANRLKDSDITIHIFENEATELAHMVQRGALSTFGIPPSIRFDRIDVSNIIDANYVGIKGTLEAWAPLLSLQPKATILGHFMNWVHHDQPDGNISNAGVLVKERLLEKMRKDGKIPTPPKSASLEERFLEASNFLYLYPPQMQTYYDNSRPFEQYLKRRSLDSTLRHVGLVRKKQHSITPYRLRSPFTASAASLPEFPGDTWYTDHQLTSHSWVERYVEFTRKSLT